MEVVSYNIYTEASLFLRLEEHWISAAKAYCYQYPLETLEISYYLMNRQTLINSADKRNGRLYGYFDDEQLLALVLFNDKGIMYISNHADKLFDKVDFLKTIRRENPTLVRGTRQQVDRVFYFLQRALKQFKIVPTLLMGDNDSTANSEPAQSIVAANTIDWQRHAGFLVEVEKQFRDRPMILNNLRQKLNNATNLDFYSVYQIDNAPLGQVVGEFSTWQYGIIGGLYISPKYRAKQYGEALMRHAAANYRAQNLKSLLYVVAQNSAAIALYKKMGYRVLLETMDLSIAL